MPPRNVQPIPPVPGRRFPATRQAIEAIGSEQLRGDLLRLVRDAESGSAARTDAAVGALLTMALFLRSTLSEKVAAGIMKGVATDTKKPKGQYATPIYYDRIEGKRCETVGPAACVDDPLSTCLEAGYFEAGKPNKVACFSWQ